eukprot:6856123-Pyramimonas_sp.AAC.1
MSTPASAPDKRPPRARAILTTRCIWRTTSDRSAPDVSGVGSMQGFAAFGRVVAGMEVVREIQGGSAGTATDVPLEMEIIRNQLLSQPVVIRRALRTHHKKDKTQP